MHRSAWTAFLASLLCVSVSAQATTGGPQTIDVLGFEQSTRRIYYVQTRNDESGEAPQVWYLEAGAVEPQRVRSWYVRGRASFEDNWETIDRRVRRLRERLRPLRSVPLRTLQMQVQVQSQRWWRLAAWSGRLRAYALSISFSTRRTCAGVPCSLQANAVLRSYRRPDVQLLHGYEVPGENAVLAVYSYTGIPVETTYERHGVVVLRR